MFIFKHARDRHVNKKISRKHAIFYNVQEESAITRVFSGKLKEVASYDKTKVNQNRQFLLFSIKRLHNIVKISKIASCYNYCLKFSNMSPGLFQANYGFSMYIKIEV